MLKHQIWQSYDLLNETEFFFLFIRKFIQDVSFKQNVTGRVVLYLYTYYKLRLKRKKREREEGE